MREMARREKCRSLAKPRQCIFNALIGRVRQRIAAHDRSGMELPRPPGSFDLSSASIARF